MEDDEDQRTLYCGNLSDQVTEKLLFELFLQAGPLQRVKLGRDKSGKQLTYAFITFKHLVSVPYAMELMKDIKLFNKRIYLQLRNKNPDFNPRNDLEGRSEHQISPAQLMDINFANQMGPYMLPQQLQMFPEDNVGHWERNRNFREQRCYDRSPYKNYNQNRQRGHSNNHRQNRNRYGHSRDHHR